MLGEISRRISKKLGKEVSEKSIENILLSAKEKPDFWELIGKSKETLVEVAEVLKPLENLGYIELGEEIILTKKGEEAVKDLGNGDWLCNSCKGRRVLPFPYIKEVFEKIASKRPKALHEFDQGYVATDVTLARISYMDMWGDLRGKRIIVLGDDDLISIAIGLTGLAKGITVVEVDKRIIDFISSAAKEYGFSVNTTAMDLRNPLPQDFMGKFDVFQTDPSESLPGFRMFLARGIASLKKHGTGYFGLTRVESSIEKWMKIEKMLLDMGVVITDMIPDFSEYVNWDYFKDMKGFKLAPVKIMPKSLWYKSTYFRVQAINPSRWNKEIMGDLYSDNEASTV